MLLWGSSGLAGFSREVGVIFYEKKNIKICQISIAESFDWLEKREEKGKFYRFYKYLRPKNGKAVGDQLKTNGKAVCDKLKPNVQIHAQCNCELNSKLHCA